MAISKSKREAVYQNPCRDCIYYHKENRTCQSKKCATGGNGKVSWVDRLFCSPCKKNGGLKVIDSICGKRKDGDDNAVD